MTNELFIHPPIGACCMARSYGMNFISPRRRCRPSSSSLGKADRKRLSPASRQAKIGVLGIRAGQKRRGGMDVRPRRYYLVRLGGVRRVVSLPARFKKAVLSTAFRLEGVSGLRPALWLRQLGAGQTRRIGRSIRSAATILGEGKWLMREQR
jgi:hypothetical protein